MRKIFLILLVTILSVNIMWAQTDYNNCTCTTTMTFPANSTITGTFTISGGATVSIISTTVYCNPDAKIIINPGCKLIVNGGTITNNVYNQMWDGIYVKGNPSASQNPESNQGKLEIKNNSLIKNAKCAIRNFFFNGIYHTGGIIQASNSTFLNNGMSACFSGYNRPDNEKDKSTFSKCIFKIDDNDLFSSNGVSFSFFACLTNIDGVKFLGCEFRNDGTTPYPNAYAIKATDAGFTVDDVCRVHDINDCSCADPLGKKSKFYNIKKGIYVNNSGTNYSFSVDEALFERCYESMEIYNVVGCSITRSRFDETVNSGNNSHVKGIKASYCNEFNIEQNTFYTNFTSIEGYQISGIQHWNGSDDISKIHRNTFENLTCAIYNNSDPYPGLQITCNDFKGSFLEDIYTSQINIGTSLTSAGNRFRSMIHTNVYSWSGTAYYYTGNANSSNLYYPSQISSGIMRYVALNANPCTSTLCTVSPLIPIKTTSATINGDISLYEEMQQVYESRLAEYNAAGYDFLLKNFNKEDDDIVVKAERMQDTLLSIRIAMAEIANRNIQAILHDTLVFDREALNGWYNRINTITAKYSLVNSYFETGEYDLARQELASIPQRFALDEKKLAEYDNFCQYNALRESVLKSGRNYEQLTEEEIAELNIIAERNTGISSSYANSILCFFYGICRDEEPEIDFDMDNTPNAPAALEEEQIDAKSIAIYVYPNPAENELNVLFNDMPDGKNTIELLDVTGRLMLSQEITSTNARIDISSLTQGVYMYRIVNGENVIARDRIVKE